MILYFSGTGNSRYVAEMIGKVTKDEIVSMNEMIKQNIKGTMKSKSPYVFVCPVYAGRIPRIVEKFIKEAKFEGSKKAYFIVTCSETPWRTVQYVEKLLNEKGISVIGFNSVIMPQNYIAMYDTPSKVEADKIVDDATPRIEKIAELIKKEKQLIEEKPGKKMMSSIINPIMYSMMISTKKFSTNGKCISCAECVKSCPLNNIKIVNAKPQWGKECTHCMACMAGCPQEAIEYGKKTKNRNRYMNLRKVD